VLGCDVCAADGGWPIWATLLVVLIVVLAVVTLIVVLILLCLQRRQRDRQHDAAVSLRIRDDLLAPNDRVLVEV